MQGGWLVVDWFVEINIEVGEGQKSSKNPTTMRKTFN